MLSLRHRWHSPKAVWIATHLLPPLGLGLLWRSAQLRLRTKLLGTLYFAAYSALFTYTLLWLLIVDSGVRTNYFHLRTPSLKVSCPAHFPSRTGGAGAD